VLPVEVGLRGEEDKELAGVGVLAEVGHGEIAASVVIVVEVLIVELGAIDGLATGAVPGGEVATLSHEARDHSMELGALEVEWLARLADSLLSCAEGTEVLSCLGDLVSEELEDNVSLFGPDLNLEEDLRVCLLKYYLSKRNVLGLRLYDFQSLTACRPLSGYLA